MTEMQRIDLTVQVPKNTVDELKSEITKLVENKFGGKIKGLDVSDAPPTGAGATLAGVS